MPGTPKWRWSRRPDMTADGVMTRPTFQRRDSVPRRDTIGAETATRRGSRRTGCQLADARPSRSFCRRPRRSGTPSGQIALSMILLGTTPSGHVVIIPRAALRMASKREYMAIQNRLARTPRIAPRRDRTPWQRG